jgi:hypothetical protein
MPLPRMGAPRVADLSVSVLTPTHVCVIPGPEPTGPAYGRPDDRLREETQNP